MSFIGDTLYKIDPNTMVLALIFIILLVLINFSLSKIFKKERASSTIISLCVSLLAVYGINRMNWDLSETFLNIGISEGILYVIVPLLVLAGLIFLLWKIKLSRTLMTLGIIFIILSFTKLVYQKAVLLIAGIILLGIGLSLWFRHKKKENLNPQNNKNGNSSQGLNILIEEARNFKSWALRTNNPKFYGSWAYFISYLSKKRGYPRGEWAICQKLGIIKNDFVRIFNRYGKV